MAAIARALGVHRSTCWRWFWEEMRAAQQRKNAEIVRARDVLEQVEAYVSRRRREKAAAQPRDEKGRFVRQADEDEQKEGAEG